MVRQKGVGVSGGAVRGDRWLIQVLPPAPVECHGSGACRQRVRNTAAKAG